MDFGRIVKTKTFWVISGTILAGIGLIVSGQDEEGLKFLKIAIQSIIEMLNTN